MRYLDRNTWFWIIISALFFIPFLGGVHLFDWDEINFAEMAREMIVTGDYLRLQINYEHFTEKPPLFFWLQALSMNVFGVGEFGARFPNALLGVIVIPFLYISGKFLINRKFGYLWALSWFGSILPFLYFKSGIIDPFFNFFIFNGLFFFVHFIWRKRNLAGVYFSKNAATYLWIAGISTGLAVLTKGPVAVLIIALCILVYWIAERFRPFVKLTSLLYFGLVVLGVFLVWFGIEYSFNGPDFIIEFTIRQWELLTTNDAGHGGFPGYHFVVLLFGCFPASLFAIPALWQKKSDKIHIRQFRKWMVILLCVILVLFSLVGTKIIHYSSMAYYPISFLSALYLFKLSEANDRTKPLFNVFVSLILIVIAAISFLLPYYGMHLEDIKPLFAKDPFALENLNAKVDWSFWDFIPGSVVMLMIFGFLAFRAQTLYASRILFFGTSIWVLTALFCFVGKVESISQRAAVQFFESFQEKEVYVTTYGYKSYVPWFYARVEPYNNLKAQDKEWLLHGAVDRPVLISCKVKSREKLEQEIPDAHFLYAKNGFYFYQRGEAPN